MVFPFSERMLSCLGLVGPSDQEWDTHWTGSWREVVTFKRWADSFAPSVRTPTWATRSFGGHSDRSATEQT